MFPFLLLGTRSACEIMFANINFVSKPTILLQLNFIFKLIPAFSGPDYRVYDNRIGNYHFHRLRTIYFQSEEKAAQTSAHTKGSEWEDFPSFDGKRDY